MKLRFTTVLFAIFTLTLPLLATPEKKADTKADKKAAGADAKSASGESKYGEKTFAGLELRQIGPAMISGRIVDLAVDPKDNRVWYIATASGGVWKTTNAGTTFNPIFDDQASYSTGCVTIDPHDSLVVWVGSGENNSQRSVAVGDGVYKSLDGGKTWKNAGLEKSEHIGKIVVDPRDSNVVYVAAQGPLWAPGGDRGLYKTTDGGKTWTKSLNVSENTGVSDVVLDPSSPDTLYAASYQRRRHVFTLIDGGPEGAIYKSTDAGKTWNKLTGGLPKGDMGRIGLALAPHNPRIVYATIEASNKDGGFYVSKDGGSSWKKANGYVAQGQYYGEVFVDPNNDDRIYSADVWIRVSDDAGKTWHRLEEHSKHPDNHVVWIDPANSDHLLVGCDGGLYESFDRAASWNYKANLPLAQFYRVSADDALPFYNVYGGTQDNFSLGGPARTPSANGIVNSDWYVTQGGDGFHSVPDPKNSNIIYAESQNGGLVRFDKRTGEALDIQPQPSGSMDPLRLNWDSPIIVSPHASNRVYFAAQYLFRSDDRGNAWKTISPDLTRHIDRNTLPVMGKVWGIDSVSKGASTSWYGNIVSLTESPLKEGLIYVGTDDGLVQVTEDSGANWRKIEHFPGVPDLSYVSCLFASQSDVNTVYSMFDNHKRGDFKPYVLKSSDRGATWASIGGDLPARGSAYALVEDPVDAKLLFAGTEYGLFVSQNGGTSWIPMKGGDFPTIPVRDLWFQKRRDDLVIATFGRGFWILDDVSPLRKMNPTVADNEATLFPTHDAELYVERAALGLPGKAFQGASYFTAPNPPFGAIFTYYLKSELKSRKKQRQEQESKLEKDIGNEPTHAPPPYPTLEQQRAEERELEPSVVMIVSDETGSVIRRVSGSVKGGFHRVAWDLRYPSPLPIDLKEPEVDVFSPPPGGPLVAPGKYTVRVVKRIDGVETQLSEPQTFNVVPLYLSIMQESDRVAVLEFQKKAAAVQRAAMGAERVTSDALERVQYIRRGLDAIAGPDPKLLAQVNAVDTALHDVSDQLSGDPILRRHNEPFPPSLLDRVNTAVNGLTTTSPPTATHRQELALAQEQLGPLLDRLHKLIEVDLAAIEKQLNLLGAPWTPGRIPPLPQ